MSKLFNKMYIKIDTYCFVDVFYKNPNKIKDLQLRITSVFTDAVYQNNPVYRCLQHEGPEKYQNILNFDEKENAKYEGSKEDILSAVISLNSVAKVGYKQCRFAFKCQNSCTSGMKRRDTALIFSLEDAS